VTGLAKFNNQMKVTEGATFMDDFYVEKAALIKASLDVNGKASLHNELNVAQGATFQSKVYIEGELGVTGLAMFYDQMEVISGATFQSNVYVKGDLGVTGKAFLHNALEVNGGATFINGDINIIGLKDVKVNGVGLQEQIAYLYSFLFNKSYATLCSEADAVMAGRLFDQNGDYDTTPSYGLLAAEITGGL